MLILARTEFDQWLVQHPGVLGLGAVGLGAFLLITGIKGVITGAATTRFGRKVKGREAVIYNISHLVGGVGLLLFGGYKIVAGLP